MTVQPTKLQRWIDLVAYLAKRSFPVEKADIWKNVPAYARGLDGTAREKAAVRRTFERDKDELRSMGVPIESVPHKTVFGIEEVTAYRLAPGFRLPVLRLISGDDGSVGGERPQTRRARHDLFFGMSREEADAALRGLKELATLPAFPWAAAAESAFRKLAPDLEPAVPAGTPVLYAPDPEAEATAKSLDRLSTALRRRKRATFKYRGMNRAEETDRRVRPYGLLFEHGRWYLLGHDEDRDDLRVFRIGRMSRVAANAKSPGKPDFCIPAGFDLRDYSGRKAWEMGDAEAEPEDADVLFGFPRSAWAERNGLGELLEARSCGAQVRRFRVLNRNSFLRWVLSLLGEARIVAPAGTCEEFREMAQSVLSIYEGGRGDE